MAQETLGSVDEALALINSTRPVLGQIADKWSVLILSVVCTQPARFNAIKRRLDGITHKSLAEALRRLERNGLVVRRVIPTSPVGVEYSITALGSTLRQPFDALCDWVLAHADDVVDAQAAYDRQEPMQTDHGATGPTTSPAITGPADGRRTTLRRSSDAPD